MCAYLLRTASLAACCALIVSALTPRRVAAALKPASVRFARTCLRACTPSQSPVSSTIARTVSREKRWQTPRRMRETTSKGYACTSSGLRASSSASAVCVMPSLGSRSSSSRASKHALKALLTRASRNT